MSADKPEARSGTAPVLGPAGSSSGGASSGHSSTGARHFLPFWVLTFLTGIAAGSLSAFVGETTYGAFALDPKYPANYGRSTGYDRAAIRADVERVAKQVLEMKRAAAAYGFLGLLLGVTVGALGGLARGSIRSGLAGTLAGAVIGVASGAGLSAALVPVYFRLMDPASGPILLFLVYAAIFAGVGAACGLALGWGLGDWKKIGRIVIGGVFGSFVGTFAFEAIDSLAFPLLDAFNPVPAEWVPRIVVHLCVATGAAVFAGLGAGQDGNRSARVR